jgi:hypothetical protein
MTLNNGGNLWDSDPYCWRGKSIKKGELKGWNSLAGNIAVKSDFLDVSNIVTARESSSAPKSECVLVERAIIPSNPSMIAATMIQKLRQAT